MFVLIWLLGGCCMLDAGGADAAECGGLEVEEWLEGAVWMGDVGPRGEAVDLLGEGTSFCCGAFLGMVKLDLVTLRAPVTWMGPGGKREGARAGAWPGFFDFAAVLPEGAAGFLDTFEPGA